MDTDKTTDKNHPKHPISIHDMDIDAAVEPATIWWRSARNEYPVMRALLMWMIYEADPVVIYSADNPADGNAFDKFSDRVMEYKERLYSMPCPTHGGGPAYIHGEQVGLVRFRCSVQRHDYVYTLELIRDFQGS